MTTFEYLAVLISIIVGLGITHLLGGVARFISNPNRYRLYWVHLVWTAYLFLYLAMFWWYQLWMNTVEEWTSLLYAFLVFCAVVLYLICAIIIPSDFPEDGDFREYFFSRRRWFFGLLLFWSILDTVDSLIKDHEIYPVLLLFFSALKVIGMVTKNAKFHAAFAASFLSLLAYGLFSGNWDRLLLN
jgi:hypothetical protein